MSYLTIIARLFHYLLKLVTAFHVACRLADRLERYALASNLSDELKAQVTAWKASTHALCEAVESFKENLPG